LLDELNAVIMAQTIERAMRMDDIIEISPTDPTAYFFNESGQNALKPGDLVGSQRHLDPAAVFSVLQLGAVVPPLSPWRGVSRYIPGYRYHRSNRMGPLQLRRSSHVAALDSDGQSLEICRLLDNAIEDAIGDGPDPVVLFSGGVDSGLIAARLSALGHRDTLLLNFSFGDDDTESHLAEAMAKHLGLRFERILESRGLCDCLMEPGRIYIQPFADHSTVPTWDLAHATVNRLSGECRPILDGTGADGAFGLIGKIEMWERVMRLPAAVRHVASHLYAAGLWHGRGRMEYLFRILRRSATMPPLSSIVAQNPLADILYDDALASDVHRLLEDWIGGWAGESLSHRAVAADMALTCTNIYAQKAKPIFDIAGFAVSFPFLQTEVMSVALASIGHWRIDEPKDTLKRCLARHVPREMVYRPKSGFVDPRGRVFYDTQFIAYLRAAADAKGPIASMLKKRPLMKACDLLARKAYLPTLTRNCLWAITFIDRWYQTAP
jgi:asparagine synthetase B (glutamine-hydrolysing)